MHETVQKIISVLRNNAGDLSTSQIIESINPDYSLMREKIGSNGVKREIAQVHRKTLHHLNKLVSMGVISVTKHGERGEKFFALKLGENEEIVSFASPYKKRIVVSRSILPAFPIEGYEQKEIVKKFEPATWIDRLNSIVVLAKNNFDELSMVLIENIFPVVNDVIHVYNFEKIINEENISEKIKKLDEECEDYGRSISLDVDIEAVVNEENLLSIIRLHQRFSQEFLLFLEYSYLQPLLHFNQSIKASFLKRYCNFTVFNLKTVPS